MGLAVGMGLSISFGALLLPIKLKALMDVSFFLWVRLGRGWPCFKGSGSSLLEKEMEENMESHRWF